MSGLHANILIFNNGTEWGHSSIVEIETPLEADGSYPMEGAQWGPEEPTWTYVASPPEEFFASHISGAQRLPNGNTLICDGVGGRIFEVTPAGETVWDYVNPITRNGPIVQGDAIPSGPGGGNQVFRAWRHSPGFPAFDGVDLVPGETLEAGA
ncbi:MAG: hypothetical protein GY898_15765 [Proteobacteria bacterium]|nr:hypothetical protein [Pseudomonadota bacterium]